MAIFNGVSAPARPRWGEPAQSLHFVTDPLERLALSHDRRFAASPHHGDRGWMMLRLDVDDVDWVEITELLEAGYHHVAPRALVEQLEHSRDATMELDG